MSKKTSLLGLLGIGYVSLLLLFLDGKYDSPSMYETQSSTALPERVKNNTVAAETKIDPALKRIGEITNRQRKYISNDMKKYEYPNGKYNISASKLEDLTLETNGTPIRSIIVATWRSGSTFLGDILNSHPSNYYYFEPLMAFGNVQARNPPLSTKALKWVKDLLNCEYQDLSEYLGYAGKRPWIFKYNPYLWEQCRAHEDVCYNPKFHSSLCKLFPFQSMKLARLRLQIAQELLADEKLAVRMVLLVRDPRGIFQSRKHRPWCPLSPDCSDPALMCADLASDYKIAVKLLKKYPTRFNVMRYEDLSLDPYKHAKELYNFYGLIFHSETRNFLESHTKVNDGDDRSTFRDSATAPFHWKTELTFEEVQEIQRVCSTAMKYWGYLPATNATYQKEFNPVTNYVLKL